jgi:hypothetical protein
MQTSSSSPAITPKAIESVAQGYRVSGNEVVAQPLQQNANMLRDGDAGDTAYVERQALAVNGAFSAGDVAVKAPTVTGDVKMDSA